MGGGSWGVDSPATIAERAAELTERATTYAEGVVEGLDITMLVGDIVNDPRPVDAIKTADMETITHAIARAFAVGYAACLDDQRPVRALGGAGERTRGAERRRRQRDRR
jgi:hypothetical protein